MRSGVVMQCQRLSQGAETMADWAAGDATRSYWLQMSAKWLKLAALFENPDKPLPPVTTPSEGSNVNF